MRHRIGLAVLVIGAVMSVVVPGSAAAATTKHCPPVKDIGPTGRDPADAVSVRATGTTCASARSLARSWGRHVVQSSGPVRIRGYVCRETMSQTTGRISVRCTASRGRVVRFKLG